MNSNYEVKVTKFQSRSITVVRGDDVLVRCEYKGGGGDDWNWRDEWYVWPKGLPHFQVTARTMIEKRKVNEILDVVNTLAEGIIAREGQRSGYRRAVRRDEPIEGVDFWGNDGD